MLVKWACYGSRPWALGLLGVMQQCVFMPNVISYNAAISACEKGKQRQQALGLLALMQQTAFLPDVISYKPRSVPVKRASNGRRPWVSWL